MLDWLKKIANNGHLQNAAGISKEALQLLRADFELLEPLKKGLPERLMQYAVDGVGEEVLGELRAEPTAHQVFALIFSDQSRSKWKQRAQFFCLVQPEDLSLFYRLGEIYLAASGQNVPHFFYHKHQWLQALLAESVSAVHYQHDQIPNGFRPNAEDIETLLHQQQQPPSELVKMFCFADLKHWSTEYLLPKIAQVPGFDRSVLRYPEEMKAALQQRAIKQLLQVIGLFSIQKIPIDPFLPELVALLMSNSKQVREATASLCYGQPAKVMPPLQRYLKKGKPNEKILAVQWLSKIAKDTALPLLSAHLEEETDEKVRNEIQTVLSFLDSKQAISKHNFDLPLLPEINLFVPLPEEIHQQILKMMTLYNQRIAQLCMSPKTKMGRSTDKIVEIHRDAIERVFTLLQGDVHKAESYTNYQQAKVEFDYEARDMMRKPLLSLVRHPAIQPIHFVRLTLLFRQLEILNNTKQIEINHGFLFNDLQKSYQQSHTPKIDLRGLAQVLSALNFPEEAIGWHYLESFRYIYPFSIDEELTWSYYAEHLSMIRQALGIEAIERQVPDDSLRIAALTILGSFPVVPGELIPYLWSVALGASKSERPLAMACLKHVPGKDQVLIDALKDAKQETRQAAAEWLGRFQVTQAITPLRDALKKEKYEAIKATILNALQQLGVSLSEMVDRQALLNEAHDGLKKGIPPALSWFPFTHRPDVHWKDTGTLVEAEVVTWWLVMTTKIGNPEPTALLLAYGELLAPKEREALARFVLEAWISYDNLRKYTQQEAADLAHQQTEQMKVYIQRYPQYYPDWSEEQHYKAVLNSLLNECKGSAIKEKGMLALVAALGGDDIAPLAHKYIKYWYGNRLHQGKALVHMLAWIDRGSAIQVLLLLATRFRTKGIQQEAEQCVQALAERKQWTIDELADRTIPTAGFDDGPEMLLDYGSRTFSARLNDEGIITLFDESGKAIKALPEARKDDDVEKVKEAKKAFSTAKKEVKNLVTMQKSRLYEAMCTQRSWRFEEWQAFLHEHPVMRLLCQRVVWQLDGQPAQTFRPLNDGTLSDAQDNEVTPNAVDLLRVAHSCTISKQQQQDWLRHYQDYEVKSLFDQFTRPLYTLPEKMKEETELNDFLGHLLEAFKLRGKVNNFGYTRGVAEDGGWFYCYEKCFPGLKIDAVLEFSGNSLPEENRLVALKTLSFREHPESNEQRYQARQIPLGEIPPVLLSECWNDLRLLAAEGSGFDKDWEKKVE